MRQWAGLVTVAADSVASNLPAILPQSALLRWYANRIVATGYAYTHLSTGVQLMIRLPRSTLIGLGLVYTIAIWVSAQPLLAERGIPFMWVAAGVAMGGALVAGTRFLPIILVGAFLGYAAVFTQLGLDGTRVIVIAVGLALSAVAQAWLGSWLVHRFVKPLPPLTLWRSLYSCGLLALAILPTSFIAVVILVAVQVPMVAGVPTTLWQWWLNVIAGVWLIVPWIVAGISWQEQRTADLLVWPVISLLLALLLFSLQLFWRDAWQQYERQLQTDTTDVVNLIDDRLARYEQAIRSIQGLFVASQEVEQHEFSTFSRSLLIQFPALQSVGWAPHVTQAERLSFERQIRENGIFDFVIREPGAPGPPAAVRDEYYPLTYVEPFARRRVVLGLDMAVEPIRRNTIAQARDSGRVMMTAPIRPYLTDVVTPAVLLIAPVYSSDVFPPTVEVRQARIRGIIMMLVSPARLIEQALQLVATPDLELLLIDTTDASLQPLAYLAGGVVRSPTVIPDPETFIREAAVVRTINRYGRSWQLVFRPGPGYPRPWFNSDAIQRSILGTATVVVVFFFIALRQTHEARQRRLMRTYALLSAINQMIIREREPQRIFAAVCQIAVQEGRFRMAWIGRPDLVAKRIEPVAVAGEARDYLVQFDFKITDDSACPTVQAFIKRQPVIINELAMNQLAAPWRDIAMQIGYRSSASFPLLVNDEVYATLNFYADQVGFFDTDELRLLNELAQDIAFAIVVGQQEAQLRASEQRNHLIVSALPDLVLRLRNDGLIIDVAAPHAMFMPVVLGDLLNHPIDQVFPPAIGAQYRSALHTAFTTGELQTLEYRLPVADRECFFEARIKAEPSSREAIAIIRDITDWRVTEQELQNERDLLAQRVAERTAELRLANTELSRAARAKDEFLANMSHELRTPLNSILALSESLLEELYGPLSERQRAAIHTLEASGRHLLTLINDVLDLAKIEAGRMDVVKEVVAASDVCEASLALIKEQANKKQIQLSLHLEDRQARFLADPRRLKQILVNLLSNAVKFTPAGGAVTLQVTTDVTQGTISFAVSDTGIGIAPEQLSRLFQPFVQLDSGLRRQHEGTGLGLVLVRRLTELHGGRVAVESTPSVGSTFTVILPYQPVLHADTSSHPDSAAPMQLALVIEDSVTTADQLARYLEELQIQPVLVTYGHEAVARAKDLRPDLILLDLQIPDRSGWEILADLKRDPELAPIPVVIVSVVDEPERGLAASAAAYLVKPINRAMLRRTLRQLSELKTDTSVSDHTNQRATVARILLAEDNETNRVILSDYLIAHGYELRVAHTGYEALALVTEWHPDLIIMDIQIPGIDGLEVIKRLRADQRFAQTPIIAVTALAMPGDRERCLLAGATDYFAKPIRLQRLVARIEQLLTRSQHAH